MGIVRNHGGLQQEGKSCLRHTLEHLSSVPGKDVLLLVAFNSTKPQAALHIKKPCLADPAPRNLRLLETRSTQVERGNTVNNILHRKFERAKRFFLVTP